MNSKKCTVLEKLLQEDWFETEKEILPWVLAGKILVNDKQIHSIKEKIAPDGIIRIKEYYKKKYVNKGGLKLEGAIRDFRLNVTEAIALDCGASTGGFTDCLLQHGAKMVYAVDAGFGQLAGKLLTNPKVVNLEKTNLADPVLTQLSPQPSIITLDLSYLSLKKAVLLCKDILKTEGEIVALIKPIFETESEEIKRSGFINEYHEIQEIIENLCAYFLQSGFDILGITYSPVRGNNGTLEYLIHLGFPKKERETINLSYLDGIRVAIETSFTIQKFNKNGINIL